MNGLPYYKAYPRDFVEGTIGMSFELKGAYRLILDLIYMQNGTLPDDARYISGHLGCSVKKWNALREKLIEAGKIYVSGDHLKNDRADKELETVGKYQDQQRQNRSRSNKNNDIQSPSFDHTEPDTDTDIPVALATGRDASLELPSPDDRFTAAIWSNGVQFLMDRGSPEGKARQVVGLWRKTATDPQIFEAFAAAAKNGVVDPVPWITKHLQPTAAHAPAITDNVLSLVAARMEADEALDQQRSAR